MYVYTCNVHMYLHKPHTLRPGNSHSTHDHKPNKQSQSIYVTYGCNVSVACKYVRLNKCTTQITYLTHTSITIACRASTAITAVTAYQTTSIATISIAKPRAISIWLITVAIPTVNIGTQIATTTAAI